MNILTKIAELKDVTNNEKIVIDFILANPEKVLNYRPSEIAAEVFVSVATLYRLINKLGLSGLGELKIELISTLKKSKKESIVDYDYPILESDTPFQMMHSLHEIYANTMEETMSFFDPEILAEVGQRLREASIIDVYTSSANLFFAENFKFQMQEIGVLINVPEESYIQTLCAANSDQNHVAIVVSYGGRGRTTTDVIKILKENKVDIILITSMQDNPLSKDATYRLYFASEENHYNKISSFSSRFSLLYIFDILYAVYFSKDYEKNLAFKLKSYQKMNKELK